LDPFQLTEEAIFDIDAIWLYLLERDGLETADRVVTDIFKGFYKPSIGTLTAPRTFRYGPRRVGSEITGSGARAWVGPVCE
jgi:plasmid stabilization system protein ParE